MRFLFVDRIVELSPGTSVKGIKHVTADDFYLTRDERGKACFIPSLIGEVLGQLAAWNVMYSNDFRFRPVAGVVASAQLHRHAYLGETLLLESFIDNLDEQAVEYHSIARIGKELVFTIEGALGPLLPMADFIAEDLVKQQFAELYRPASWPMLSEQSVTAEILYNKNPQNNPMSFDEILACEPGQSLVAQKRLSRAAPYFPDHFPHKPVLPLTILLESNLNLAKEFIVRSAFSSKYQIRELRKIKMNGFVYPGDIIISYLKVKEHKLKELTLSFRTEVEGRRVCVVDLLFCELPGDRHLERS